MDATTPYEIWIEAEKWSDRSWDKYDTNTDVVVKFGNGERWVASFFTYKNIYSLADKNKETGENLFGKYLWGSDMILIEECSRSTIEAVITNLIREKGFESVFSKCEI